MENQIVKSGAEVTKIAMTGFKPKTEPVERKSSYMPALKGHVISLQDKLQKLNTFKAVSDDETETMVLSQMAEIVKIQLHAGARALSI
ncbi:MAG: hypothetical protein JWQ09_5880 [Segetibacter sp.]|nr:hypothetical protein [Segetibacter sp.]